MVVYLILWCQEVSVRTIKVSEGVIAWINSRKNHYRETYNDVLERVVQEEQSKKLVN